MNTTREQFQVKVLLDYAHFLNKQKAVFEKDHHLMPTRNHKQHNDDPEYWDILLKDIVVDPSFWENKHALDFGCGCGRNIENLLNLAKFKRVDGCDISLKNSKYAKGYINDLFGPEKCQTWENDGYTLKPAKDDTYDFVMSHIVFQHIPNYDVRFSILLDIYRVLKEGGIASLHFMDLSHSVTYYENSFQLMNCVVENPNYLIEDFEKIGFKNVTCEVGTDLFTKLPSYHIRGVK